MGINFKEPIRTIYPPNNLKLFEQWFDEKYDGCKTDRELLPIYFNGFYVNNNYGNDLAARKESQNFLYSLDISKKWFTIIQYDDSILDDVSHLDLFRFEMSKNIGCQIPLLCQPHPYSFSSEKKYLVNFIGSRTHQIRNELEQFKNKEGWYISFDHHNIEDYCRIIHESIYTLCPRGYGASSFRICEALQYNSIPIYLSDEHIQPFSVNFNEYGIRVNSVKEVKKLLDEPDLVFAVDKLSVLPRYYEKYYTYQGCFNEIIKSLETEYRSRQENRALATADERVGDTRDNGL